MHGTTEKKKNPQSITPRVSSKANYRPWVMMRPCRFISGIMCPTLRLGVGGAVSRGGCTWLGEADRGYTRLCFPLSFTMNLKLFQKNKINFKTFKLRVGMSMYTRSLLLPFFFNMVTHSCNFLTSNQLFRVYRNICKTSLENRRDWHNTVNQLYLNKKIFFLNTKSFWITILNMCTPQLSPIT